jgi:hypothetical protein
VTPRRVWLPILSLAALLAVHLLEPVFAKLPGGNGIRRTLAKARSRELHAADMQAQAAGYYEDLLNQAAQGPGSRSLFSRLLNEPAADADDGADSAGASAGSGFLAWAYKPNNKIVSRDGSVWMANSFGMADKQYTLEKPPNTRRIALLGDSVIRGSGVEFGKNFEALTENWLNETQRSNSARNYEILNFAVQGYRITQTVDVLLERTPPFKPDVYVVGMTELTAYQHWAVHLAVLITRKKDLKYDYLRQLARRTNLKASEEIYGIQHKLEPHRMDVMRWAFTEMKAGADRQGSKLILLLVPSVFESRLAQAQFAGIPVLARELGIPVIDLLDVYKDVDVEDLDSYRVSSTDRHPNERGHKLIFDALCRKIQTDAEIASILLDQEPNPAVRAAR